MKIFLLAVCLVNCNTKHSLWSFFIIIKYDLNDLYDDYDESNNKKHQQRNVDSFKHWNPLILNAIYFVVDEWFFHLISFDFDQSKKINKQTDKQCTKYNWWWWGNIMVSISQIASHGSDHLMTDYYCNLICMIL